MLIHLAEGSDFGALIFILVFVIIPVVGKIIEKLRSGDAQEQERKKREAAGQQQGSQPAVSGLEALLQALEKGSAGRPGARVDHEDVEEPDDDGQDSDDREAELRELAEAEADRTHEPDAAVNAEVLKAEAGNSYEGTASGGGGAETRARVISQDEVEEAERRVEESERVAREAQLEAERIAEQGPSLAPAEEPAAEHAAATTGQETHAADAVPAVAGVSESDAAGLRAGIIWAAVLGRPRGVSGYGSNEAGDPVGLS